ncbi:MAG: single-stranded DNA-binding protein [Clostridia bacterium]|nr:single-stranded DNA-binding protein [Clostridia bacterium]
MTNLLTENNKVTLFGKVVKTPEFSHEVYGEKFYEFTIEVNRLSESVDLIPVIFSERLVPIDEIKLETTLQILGQYRSYNNQTDGKSKLVLMVFAREIEITDSMTIENANEIYLEGFVCKKPNYRKTPFGREISDLLIAVNRAYNKSDYIPCIAWGRNAKYCESFNVGDKVKVYGRVQSREYEKKFEDGTAEKRVAYEISVSKLEIVKEEEEGTENSEKE